MEVWFYHLGREPLARALPVLVEKALARGWRVVVQTGDPARLKALDDLLWKSKPESFIPHGTDSDGDPARHPVLLTCGTGNANGAALRIHVEGAPVELDGSDPSYERVMLVFDGNDEAELTAARGQWSSLKARGFALAYWQQDDDGRWNRKM